jgi:hypothetical protein
MWLQNIISSEWTYVNTIKNTENYVLAEEIWKEFPEGLKKLLQNFRSLTEKTMTVQEIEKNLQENFWSWKIIMFWDQERLASCIWLKDTQLHRSEEKIILPWTKFEENPWCQHNISWTVVDPIGWASRTMAPNEYWLFWKIPEFRWLKWNESFNKELHKELMNCKVTISDILWYACEISLNEDNWTIQEIAIMPTVSIEWKEAREILEQFNEELKPGDIPTSKHYILNNL